MVLLFDPMQVIRKNTREKYLQTKKAYVVHISEERAKTITSYENNECE
jgi:hypothetical protein